MAQKEHVSTQETVQENPPRTEPGVEKVQARKAGDEDVGTARDTMASAVSTTERISSGVVDGVAHVAEDVIGAVRDTANTAISGVGSVGGTAVHTLTGLLVDVVGGVRQIAGAAVGGVKSTAQEAFRRPQQLSGEEASRSQEAPHWEQASRRETPAAERTTAH